MRKIEFRAANAQHFFGPQKTRDSKNPSLRIQASDPGRHLPHRRHLPRNSYSNLELTTHWGRWDPHSVETSPSGTFTRDLPRVPFGCAKSLASGLTRVKLPVSSLTHLPRSNPYAGACSVLDTLVHRVLVLVAHLALVADGVGKVPAEVLGVLPGAHCWDERGLLLEVRGAV